MPIGSSTTHRAQQRVHQAQCTGARRAVRQQVAEDGPGRLAHPWERCGQTPERPVLRPVLPQLLTSAPPPNARIISVPTSSPLVTIHAAPSTSDQEDEPSAAGRTTLELAEVIRRFGPEYRRQAGEQLTVQQDRVLRELLVCRTEVLGAHYWSCERCGKEVEMFHSCKNRHCPKCGAYERFLWAHQVQADLLPLEYQHVVVTLPRPLTLLACDHPRVLYPLVLRAGADAILRLTRRELEAELGVLILLHSWGQLMNQHVHAHGLVSCGGLWLHRKPKRRICRRCVARLTAGPEHRSVPGHPQRRTSIRSVRRAARCRSRAALPVARKGMALAEQGTSCGPPALVDDGRSSVATGSARAARRG